MNSRVESSWPVAERVLEFSFFSILFVYVGAMLLNLPSGDSGFFPTLLLPVAVILLSYRLATIVLPGSVLSSIAQTFPRQVGPDPSVVTESTAIDEAEVRSLFDFQVEMSDLKEIGITVIWIIAAFLVIYILGLLIGGLLYIIAFLYFSGDYRPRTAVGVGVAYTVVLYAMVFIFEFRIWRGLIYA